MKQEKQDRRSQRTRGLVAAALLELMQEKRYDAITVRDLLDRAGIGRSTFYAHYFNKDDAMAAMLEEQMPRQEIGQGIVASLDLFRHIYEQPEQHAKIIQGVRSHTEDPLWEIVNALLSETIEQALIAACGEKSPPAIPLPLVAEYLAGTLENLLKWWIVAEMPYSPEEMDRFFQQLALPGVIAVIAGTRN
ncbi:MAG: TetR/AcrR family transcriptional regulator [Thermomicrobiales bacterium]